MPKGQHGHRRHECWSHQTTPVTSVGATRPPPSPAVGPPDRRCHECWSDQTTTVTGGGATGSSLPYGWRISQTWERCFEPVMPWGHVWLCPEPRTSHAP
jgi:hypothetical protein